MPLTSRLTYKHGQGCPPPSGNIAFPPVSDFPPISKKFSDRGKFSQFHLFPKKFFRFSLTHNFTPIFALLLLVIDSKCLISPYFRSFNTFPSYFKKIIKLCVHT